jgi:hypothetical protein
VTAAVVCFGVTRVASVCGVAFRAGTGLGFGFALCFAVAFGGAYAARAGGVDVTTGRGAGVDVDVAVARWTSGDGAEATLLCFGATATGAEATTGASGVGTAAAARDGCDWFDGFDCFEDVVAAEAGGSSGVGIGVPPAAKAAAGQASATTQAPTATESRLSRRDVHLETTSPLSEPHGTSVDARVSIRARVAAACSAATLLART